MLPTKVVSRSCTCCQRDNMKVDIDGLCGDCLPKSFNQSVELGWWDICLTCGQERLHCTTQEQYCSCMKLCKHCGTTPHPNVCDTCSTEIGKQCLSHSDVWLLPEEECFLCFMQGPTESGFLLEN